MRLAGMNERKIRLVESTGRTQPRITLTAPISGVLAELMVREGMTVMPGATIARISGLSTVWAQAEVPESQSALLRPGAKVQAHSPAVPGTTFDGTVQAIVPEVNSATRTLKARGTHQCWAAGARHVRDDAVHGYAPAEISASSYRSDYSNRHAHGGDAGGRQRHFQACRCEAGIESGGQTEIKRGLQAGQRVVVSSQFLIDSKPV